MRVRHLRRNRINNLIQILWALLTLWSLKLFKVRSELKKKEIKNYDVEELNYKIKAIWINRLQWEIVYNFKKVNQIKKFWVKVKRGLLSRREDLLLKMPFRSPRWRLKIYAVERPRKKYSMKILNILNNFDKMNF